MFKSLLSPYSILTIIIFIGVAYTMYKINILIVKLGKQVVVPRHKSGAIWIRHLKSLVVQVKGTIIEDDAKKALLFMRINYYLIYVGFAVFILMMLIGIPGS